MSTFDIGNDSSKTVLAILELARITSRESPKQEIKEVKSTTNQSIRAALCVRYLLRY